MRPRLPLVWGAITALLFLLLPNPINWYVGLVSVLILLVYAEIAGIIHELEELEEVHHIVDTTREGDGIGL